MVKSFLKKSALLENSKAYPSWQKMRENDNFFSSSDKLLDFKKNKTFCCFYKAFFS